MNNEVLKTILFKKEITIKDRILFKTIFEVLSTLFTNEDGVSILKSGYKINDYQQVWFLTISPNSEKEEVIKTGYANFLSEDWNVIYQFNSTSTSEKRKQLGEKYIKDKVEFVTFVKIKEKSKGIGYHFIGIFVFDNYRNKDYKTMVFKKIKDIYKDICLVWFSLSSSKIVILLKLISCIFFFNGFEIIFLFEKTVDVFLVGCSTAIILVVDVVVW